jgi:hypothetical protein
MLSRRAWFGLVTVAGAYALTGRKASTETPPPGRVSKEVAKYQDQPNNMQMCGMCKFYIPPGGKAGTGMMGGQMGSGMMGQGMMRGGNMMAAGTCQVVEGSISPMGWCVLYQAINT